MQAAQLQTRGLLYPQLDRSTLQVNLETLPNELAIPSSVGEVLAPSSFTEVDLSVERATLERGKKLPSSMTNAGSVKTPSSTSVEKELGNIMEVEDVEGLEKSPAKESRQCLSPPTTDTTQSHDDHFHEESSIAESDAVVGETKEGDDNAELHKNLISSFSAITQADEAESRAILQECNWGLEAAITRFYDK